MRRQRNKSVDNLFDRIGRNTFRTNSITPEIIVGPIWLPDDEPSTVEIIELNSSNEEATSPKVTTRNKGNAWSFSRNLNNDGIPQTVDGYKINTKARERRRLQNANPSTHLPSAYTTTEENNDIGDFTNIYTNHTDDIDENLRFSHQMNCFTIINKHLIESDTSTEEDLGDIEMMASDIILDSGTWDSHNNTFNNDEIVTYDADIDQETRTIWIYSFKNKHLLSDELGVNIYDKDKSSSGTSYSTDSSGDYREDKDNTSGRLGSPTAPTYVPRLDLSLVPTLSTVTEISESNVQATPKGSINTPSKIKKPANSWFVSESAKDGMKSVRKHEKCTNIINWMSLSPREKRRVLKSKSMSDTWVGSHLNLADICRDIKTENRGDQTYEIAKDAGENVEVNVDVHVDTNSRENVTITNLKSAGTAVKADLDDITLKRGYLVREIFQKDRGDHKVKSAPPAIQLDPKKLDHIEISEPIEKLENNDWVRETKEEKETSVYDYVLEKSESVSNADNTIDQMWMKNNVPFLKPSKWTEFVKIAETPESYHLSLGSIIEERQTWYKRLINFLKCCK